MRLLQLLALPFLAVPSERPTPAPSITGPVTPASAAIDSTSLSVRWNRLVPRFADEASARRRAARTAAAGDSAAMRRLAQSPPPILFRVYTLLGVAQYAAVSSAQAEPAASVEAAIASASAAVLMGQFPDSAVRASIARELDRDLALARSGSRGAAGAQAGRRVGEDVARRVIAWAPPLDFGAGANPTIPTGPGMWRSARGAQPEGTFLARSRPWMIDSASQFRPAPPLAYGSPAFEAALGEVRRVARELTPEQARIARYWGLADPWALWNDVASAALRRHRVSEADAARVLALLNVAASDAVLACFDAKYHYWSIRPSQVDSTIALPDSIALPNFPSYPSGHACSAGAFDAVLGHFIPQQRAEFTRMAEEQAMARLYGGVHYRFDNDAGLALGRAVGRHVVERERHGGFNAWRESSARR
jgi:membrane-associated phospholipid phosphatase